MKKFLNVLAYLFVFLGMQAAAGLFFGTLLPKITVKLLEIDPKTGKYKLSHRVLVEKPEGYVERPARGERRPRPERGERRPRPERGERRPRPERHDHNVNANDEYHEPTSEPKDFNDSLDNLDF